MFKSNFLHISLCLLPVALSINITENSLTLSSLLACYLVHTSPIYLWMLWESVSSSRRISVWSDLISPSCWVLPVTFLSLIGLGMLSRVICFNTFWGITMRLTSPEFLRSSFLPLVKIGSDIYFLVYLNRSFYFSEELMGNTGTSRALHSTSSFDIFFIKIKKDAGKLSSPFDSKGRGDDWITNGCLCVHTYIWLNKSKELKEHSTLPSRTSRWW